MRCGFFESLVTARQRHAGLSHSMRTPSSTIDRTAPAETWSFASASTLEVSIVQYRVSVMVDGVVPIDDIECTFAGTLFGGVRATSAYEGLGLVFAESLRAAFTEMTSS